MRSLLVLILRVLAKATVKKFQPEIVAVTGSAGKTSTKEAVYAVLKCRYHVRKNHANFNNEVGVPLTILGDYKKSGNLFFWAPVLIAATLRIIAPKFLLARYPEVLILEYAADRPGDISYLTEVARPTISIVTLIGETPVHVEFYQNVEAVAKEKEMIVRALSTRGFAILNKDDIRVFAMKRATRGQVITYGFNEESDLKISDYEVETQKQGDASIPIGIRFVLSHKNESLAVVLPGVIGKAQAYATCAAAAVGITKGMKLVEVGKAISYYRPPQSRLSFVRGLNQSFIIDDSYNSSPAAAKHALESIASLKPKRAVCVLGDMRELGSYTEQAHKLIGEVAAKSCNVLVTIGPSAGIIADQALKQGLDKKNIHRFQSVEEAKESVKKLIEPGDIILIKASLAVGAAKLVEALRA